MKQKVIINHFPIEVNNLQIKEVSNRCQISFEFPVTHEDYHNITTLLYENDFTVKVPAENLKFSATISNYSTSFTNLYVEGAEGEFKLELIEKEN